MRNNPIANLADSFLPAPLEIKEIKTRSNMCEITISMEWEVAHAMRKFLAPFLHHFCAGIDVRSRQEKIWDIEKMRAQEAEKKSRIRKIRYLRAIYKDGLSYEEWKKGMGSFGYNHSKQYYDARRRAIIWLKNRGLKPRHICAHFDIGYPTYYAAAKTTQ